MESENTDNALIIDENESRWTKLKKRFSSAKVDANQHEQSKEDTKNQRDDKLFAFISKNLNNKINYSDFEKDIQGFLDRGANINYKNKQNDTVLHLVASLKQKEDSIKLFKFLIKKNCKEEKNYYGLSVLHSAANADNDLLIEYILNESQGKDSIINDTTESKRKDSIINDTTYDGKQTALHLAAKTGARNALFCLLKYGADMEAKDYLHRTPLYLAAEYGQEAIVRILLKNGCSENVISSNGQKAIFWIVAKCPNLAAEVLDKYRELDKYSSKDTYYLGNVELCVLNEGKDERTGQVIEKIPDVKSIIEIIVEQKNLDLIIHPVISKLIKFKWKNKYRLWAYFKFFIDLYFCVVWNLWGVLVAYDKRYIYNFPEDSWRIVLFILGIIGVILIIALEIKEYYDQQKHKTKLKEKRMEEIRDEGAKVHPKDSPQNQYLLNEEKICKKSTHYLKAYLLDGWNFLDITSIILIIVSLSTHLADVVNHNETIARNHIRVTSITVLISSLRILKSARTLWEPFGMLVMTLYHIVRDIVVWMIAFVVVWIPFTSCFYMLFGNGLRVKCDPEPDVCTNTNGTLISGMETFNKAAFFLYTKTLGADFPFDKFNELDNDISDFVIGLYIGATTLILVNIFIALLTTTFERVHTYSKANFLMERAKEILELDRGLSDSLRIKLIKKLPIKYITKYEPQMRKDDTIQEIIEPLNESVNELNEKYDTINNNFLDMRNELKTLQINQNLNPPESRDLQKIQKSIDELRSKKSKVDVLYLSDIDSSVRE